jgi:glyoxylase-like metal-dependent hydrolase (beta-lactamase superfamily II)
MRTWPVRSEGRTNLVDTGIGNGKARPYLPLFTHRNTGFLDNLARAGVRPEDVDVVVCTHVHGDHVDWNTFLAAREWVSTFPSARSVISHVDFEYWNPENKNRTRSGCRVQRIEPAPGHTGFSDHHTSSGIRSRGVHR